MIIEQALRSGGIVDYLLVLLVLEVVFIALYWRKTGRGIPLKLLVPTVGAGACLMLAMRAVIQQSSLQELALWLLCSLLFHIADLRQRWTLNNR